MNAFKKGLSIALIAVLTAAMLVGCGGGGSSSSSGGSGGGTPATYNNTQTWGMTALTDFSLEVQSKLVSGSGNTNQPTAADTSTWNNGYGMTLCANESILYFRTDKSALFAQNATTSSNPANVLYIDAVPGPYEVSVTYYATGNSNLARRVGIFTGSNATAAFANTTAAAEQACAGQNAATSSTLIYTYSGAETQTIGVQFMDGPIYITGVTVKTNTALIDSGSSLLTQTAPSATAFSVTDETATGNDGQIAIDTTTLGAAISTLEYKLSSDSTYTTVTATPITALAPGTYNFRFAGTATHYASPTTDVTVAAYVNPNVTFTALPFTETFSTDGLLASYELKQSDGIAPMYRRTGGTPTVTGGQLTLSGARFTVGDKTGAATTIDSGAQGDFDFSTTYEISFDLISLSATEDSDLSKKHLFVYIDNNSSGGSGSRLGSSSILYNETVADLLAANVVGTTIKIPSTNDTLATGGSFIQIRTESNVTAVIDNLRIGPPITSGN